MIKHKYRKFVPILSFMFVWVLIDITSPYTMSDVRLNTNNIVRYRADIVDSVEVGTILMQADGTVLTTDKLTAFFDSYFCNGGNIPCP